MIAVVVLLLVGLLSAALLYPWAIRGLRQARMGQTIREEGPAAHQGKAGTPTAGGSLFIALALVIYLIVDRSLAGALVVLALVAGGILGLLDDLRAIVGGRNLGLRAREKIVVQMLIGGVIGWLAWQWGFDRQLVPFDGRFALGAWLIPIGVVAVAAGSNAFNLTDGSDGLAAGAGAVLFAALAVVALWFHASAAALMPAALVGLLLGFLIYNLYPARIFMGDTGSLALGTAMVAAALTTGFLWYLPLLALIFVVETLSVIAQVASFKATGRRIIKMSPLHHHFQLSGWSEMRVATSFWAVGLAAAVLCLLIVRWGRVA
jgi:phospho-N-acetylmuramoyl-pentapeptide-transferase